MATKTQIGFLILFFLTVSSGWAAPQAVLQSLKGKVEVRTAGATAWVPATEGEALSPSTTLSTGFDSSVVVVIDKTTIQVKPLTRMTIDKLVLEGGTVKTSTFLRVGAISASVKSVQGVAQDFKVQSPYATASVRGTEFDFNGFHLKVREGLVAFIIGRLQRESQPAENPGTEPAAADRSTDFVGSPDVAADPDKAVPVPAGTDAQLVLDYKGGDSKTSRSDDLDSLKKDSGQNQGPSRTPVKPVPTKGGVTLSIQFGS